jgi:hypothetical protein
MRPSIPQLQQVVSRGPPLILIHCCHHRTAAPSHTLPFPLPHQRYLLPAPSDGCPRHLPQTLLRTAVEPQNTKTAAAASTMNARQHEDNDDADNSDVDVGNSGDDTDDGSVNIAGGEKSRERRSQRVWHCNDSHDNDDEIEYGYHRSRQRTSYKNRGSSSLTPCSRPFCTS